MAYLVAGVAGVVFFAMSVMLLGVWPGRVLERQVRAMSPDHALGLSDSERRGRGIYAREGCAYCHTQQVRFVHADMTRFGAPTLAWETRFDYPHLWGTRRIGPDLARVGGTRAEDWHYLHLYSPRAVVPDSVMPSYAALFDGAPDRPRQEARDLVAYLESLGRAREVAGDDGEARAREGCDCEEDEMAQMSLAATVLNASPARTRPRRDTPLLPATADEARGRVLYDRTCAACHGARGEGDGPGASALRPRPANLAEHEYSLARLTDVLRNGVAGTSMPAWRDHPVQDLAAIAAVVRGLSVAHDQARPSVEMAKRGRTVYEANCAQCHGKDGAGDGFAVGELRVAPTDFRRQRPSLAASLRAIRDGVEGTQMAPWRARLSDDEMLAAAYHVRTFFQRDGGTVRSR
jgi:mono/diheme cytochrome c family protein